MLLLFQNYCCWFLKIFWHGFYYKTIVGFWWFLFRVEYVHRYTLYHNRCARAWGVDEINTGFTPSFWTPNCRRTGKAASTTLYHTTFLITYSFFCVRKTSVVFFLYIQLLAWVIYMWVRCQFSHSHRCKQPLLELFFDGCVNRTRMCVWSFYPQQLRKVKR